MDSLERRRIGEKASITGILCNLVLFVLKLIVGSAGHSLSVVADAFNNMTDFVSSFVSLVSVRLSGKPADREHPFGHGRTEYIAGFLVAVLILIVGVNLLRSSVERLLSPSPLQMSTLGILLLSATILIKFVLFLYFRRTGLRADLPVLLLSSKDALFDCLTTFITICAMLFSRYVSVNLDAWAALALSCLILITSIRQIRSTATPLLGSRPTHEMTRSLTELASEHPQVLDVHDVLLHDYGYHLYVGSMHVSLPESLSFHDVHAVADAIEHEAMDRLGIQLVVHADPVAVNDPIRDDLMHTVQEVLSSCGNDLSIHDFQLDHEAVPAHLSFDVQMPYAESALPEENLRRLLTDALHEKMPDLVCQIQIDHV